MRLILGFIKGLIIGGAVGFGAFQLGLSGGFHWVTYGLVGALVGLLAGRPIWSHLADKNSTVIVAVLKGIVGAGIAIGLYALVAKVLNGIVSFPLGTFAEGQAFYVHDWQFVLGGAIGGIYGAWVESDDAPKSDGQRALPPKQGDT